MSTKQIQTKLVRYAFVGIATSLIDYLVFTAIFLLSGNYLLAENLKLPFMLGFNYTAHRLFTFGSSQRLGKELIKYILANIVIFITANVSLVSLVSILGDVQFAKLVQLLTMPIFSYLVLNKLVYKSRKSV